MNLRQRQRLLQLNIVNVVATAELGQFVNVNKLAMREGFLYDRDIYNCAYLKNSETIGKVSIFASGKMISVGSRAFRAAKHDLNYAVGKLVELGLVEPTKIKVKLQNLVATARIGVPIDMRKLVKIPNVIYEPEQFPGAIYYAPELEGASILVFANGKIVLAGLKNEYLLSVGKQVVAELAMTASF